MHMTIGLCLAACMTGAVAGCGSGTGLVLTRQLDARRLASNLRVEFGKAAAAANRAVMADNDEASRAAVREVQQATQAVERDIQALQPILQSLDYRDVIGHLEAFKARFGEYRALDAEILSLAVENTNVKAQQLSFGPARESAKAFRQSLEAASRPLTPANAALVAKAVAAVLEILVLQAPHIAEADEAAMSRMEMEMAASEAAARTALADLKVQLPAAAASDLTAAAQSIDRFMTINAELVALSRRNSNVRSLALSLGRKRTVTAECDAILEALEGSLSRHGFTATR